MSNPLATRQLTKTQLQQLSTYTDPGTILAALAKNGWTIQKAINKLITIIDSEDTKVSTQLAAIKYLNQMVIDTMERSGMMVIATKKILGDDGEEITFTGHIVSSNLQGTIGHTTLEELTGDDYPKDVKEIKDGKETKTTETAGAEGKRETETASGGGATEKTGDRAEQDSSRPDGKLREGQKRSTKTDREEPKSDDRKTDKSGFTEAGLSNDLHTSRHPELHLDSFKGVAVPSESRIPGPADTTGVTETAEAGGDTEVSNCL